MKERERERERKNVGLEKEKFVFHNLKFRSKSTGATWIGWTNQGPFFLVRIVQCFSMLGCPQHLIVSNWNDIVNDSLVYLLIRSFSFSCSGSNCSSGGERKANPDNKINIGQTRTSHKFIAQKQHTLTSKWENERDREMDEKEKREKKTVGHEKDIKCNYGFGKLNSIGSTQRLNFFPHFFSPFFPF